MPKPVTPLVGCDVFILNAQAQVLLIRRADDGLWALPGGCQNLGETPRECAERECLEESGYQVAVTELLGVFSSRRYEYRNYPWKENEFCHILFRAEKISGEARPSGESTEIRWFSRADLPSLSDGHGLRVEFAFKKEAEPQSPAYWE